MKITSICERQFIESCIAQKKRLDGRTLTVGRTLHIKYSEEWGCCMVSLGNTRVLAQISAEVTEPKPVSPTEGGLLINLELAISAADSGINRGSDEFIEKQRCLERCIRDSKCVDLESLCIVAGSKVWTIRVDVHALNEDGNLLECASIAAISSLAHFKRPDVTVIGTEVTEYSLDDREPVPLNLHHMPIIVNLALYEQGQQILVDPTISEEKTSDGCYVIGINAHQEICFIHRNGVLLLSEEIVEQCEDIAIRRAQDVTQVIRSALDDDSYKRATKAPVGFIDMLETGSILSSKQNIHGFDLKSITGRLVEEQDVVEDPEMVEDPEVVEAPGNSNDNQMTTVSEKKSRRKKNPKTSAAKERALRILEAGESLILEGGASRWKVGDEEGSSSKNTSLFEGGSSKWKSAEDSSSGDEEEEEEDKSVNVSADVEIKKELDLSSEEETQLMESDEVDIKPSTARGWNTADPFS